MRQPTASWRSGFFVQVGEYLVNDYWIFDAGDHFDGAAAFTACLNVDIENALQSLSPGHGRATFARRVLVCLIARFGLVALTPFGGRYQGTMLAVGGKHTVKAGEVDFGLGHQRRQPGDKV